MLSRTCFAVATVLVLSVAACASNTGEGDLDTVGPTDENLTVGATLTMAQIHEIHGVTLGKSAKVSYTGQPRYLGVRVHAAKGTRLEADAEINQEVFPVAVIADAKLKVLAAVRGFTITGAPGTSNVFADVIAPSEGTFWLLYGEASRKPFEMKIGARVRQSAASACNTNGDCISDACTKGKCALGKPFQDCLKDTDCTTAKCDPDGNECAPLPLGAACKSDDDCESTFCDAGKCFCFPAGHPLPASQSNECCSKSWTSIPSPQCQ
jgi:hypothetical protein